MKSIFAIVLLAVIISCNNSATTEKKEAMSMPGAYTMLSQTVSDGKRDTVYANLKQLKIYTPDYMMYANVNPSDSVSGFGIGTYSSDSGMIKENVIYNASDTSASDNPGSFTLMIEKTAKGYKQVIPELTMGNTKVKLTEEYETAGTATTTALDGAWKETKAYTIKGKDTTMRPATQYKTYYAGHFIFGHTYKDSANKIHTGMGYGTFTMGSANKITENVVASTYGSIRGKSFDIAIEMTGTDAFKQTISETTGEIGVEFYQRLKK